ncbi:hypothetical protein A3Q56_06739, partial [Intoshia linei]
LKFVVLPHPPYSTDLAPSDYYLFIAMSNHYYRKKYTSNERLKLDIETFLSNKVASFYTNSINRLPERWKKTGKQLNDECVEEGLEQVKYVVNQKLVDLSNHTCNYMNGTIKNLDEAVINADDSIICFVEHNQNILDYLDNATVNENEETVMKTLAHVTVLLIHDREMMEDMIHSIEQNLDNLIV